MSTSTSRYNLVGRLTGHAEPVYVLAASAENGLLASGGTLTTRGSSLRQGLSADTTGDEGVLVWDLQTLASVTVPLHNRSFGPVTAMTWATRELDDMLVYGTGSGYIVIFEAERGVCSSSHNASIGQSRLTTVQGTFRTVWNYKVPTDGEVHSLCAQTTTNSRVRIAYTTRNRAIEVVEFSPPKVFTRVYGVEMGATVPRAAVFAENGHDLHVFSMFDGMM